MSLTINRARVAVGTPPRSRDHAAARFPARDGSAPRATSMYGKAVANTNVVRGLRRCFGLRTTVVTAIVDNEVGRLLEDLMLQGGVDLSHVKWVPFDGIGRTARVGLNFTERGYGLRGAVGCSDRGWAAASQLAPGQVNWKQLFEEEGVRWFHCGGIFAALSATTADTVIEAMEAARAAGTVISYDLNFGLRSGNRRRIERGRGGQPPHRLAGGCHDRQRGGLHRGAGFKVPDMDEHISKLDPANFRKMIAEVVTMYPNFQAVATTLRNAKTATLNDWGAILWTGGEFYEAPLRENLEIFDRVGGGDSFASGLAYAFLAVRRARKQCSTAPRTARWP